jgi:hypothetical protein
MNSKAFHRPLLMLLCLVIHSGHALAQTNPQAEASQHFERGIALAKQKAYPEAIVEFNQAYQKSPHFSVMYNLGQAYVAIDQPVYAVEALRRYLIEGKTEIPASRREQVEATLIAQEQRIATVTLRCDAVGAVVRLDGVEMGRTPLAGPIRLNAGKHHFDATLSGYQPWEQGLSLAGTEQRTIDIRFSPLVAAPAKAATTVPVAPQPSPVTAPMVQAAAPGPGQTHASAPVSATAPQPTTLAVVAATPQPTSNIAAAATPGPAPGRARRITAYVLGATGLGAIGVGSAFGLVAFSKKSDSDKECPGESCSNDGVRFNDQARTAAWVSNIGFGVGLAALGVATYLLLVPGSTRSPDTRLSGLQVSPQIGQGQAGATIGGVW